MGDRSSNGAIAKRDRHVTSVKHDHNVRIVRVEHVWLPGYKILDHNDKMGKPDYFNALDVPHVISGAFASLRSKTHSKHD